MVDDLIQFSLLFPKIMIFTFTSIYSNEKLIGKVKIKMIRISVSESVKESESKN